MAAGVVALRFKMLNVAAPLCQGGRVSSFMTYSGQEPKWHISSYLSSNVHFFNLLEGFHECASLSTLQ